MPFLLLGGLGLLLYFVTQNKSQSTSNVNPCNQVSWTNLSPNMLKQLNDAGYFPGSGVLDENKKPALLSLANQWSSQGYHNEAACLRYVVNS